MTTYGIVAALLLAQAGAPGAAPQGRGAPELVKERPAPKLALDDALREAREKNLDLKVAQARLDESRQLSAKAWSAYLPQVSAGGTFTHNNFGDVILPAGSFGPGSPPVLVTKQNQLAGQIQATQAIFAPQAVFAIEAANAGERLASDSTEQARQDILFAVAQAYYGAATLKQVVIVNDRQLAIAREHERDAKIRYDAGAAPKVTLLRAEIDRARAEQDLKRAENSYLSGKVALATLLDRRTADFEVDVPPPVQLPPPESLEEAALRDRFDVRAAQEQLTVAAKTRDGIFASYFPTLGAFGRYQYSNAAGFTGDKTTWAIGLSLNWNIFDGGLREANLRENQARVVEAEASRESLVAKARDELVRARLDLDSAVANREKAKEQLSLAEENQRLVNVNYKAGAATYIEVSDANTALLTAELTQVSEGLNAELAALRLLKAGGAFSPR
jgi:outer membrane protein TolC